MSQSQISVPGTESSDGGATSRTRRPTNPAAEEILGQYFPVLDHGFVALVDYMGGDDSIERAARVSYGYGTRRSSQTRGLIRYLRRHRHTTPSEMVELQFHCAMPMFVARQWIRHRTANVNEYSGRYSLIPLLFYTPQAGDFALQSEQNNQGRSTTAADESLYDETVARWERLRADAMATYSWLVGEDVARELARIELPLSTYTQWYWKIDLHNLLHFLTLRVDPHAQLEIRAYAEVIAGMVKRVAPLSYEAWIDYDVAGAHLSRGELSALRALVESGADSVTARAGAALSTASLAAHELSAREGRELIEKLRARAHPDFELDLSRMRSAAAIEARMQEAVPKPDRQTVE
ncbi:MAG TPA: FAD-dependent thymidylate synthase [Longimicrobiales bacterium]|nr:FAD-dependent thymidylate synthase [Longimicrobiales bacterium]